MAPADLIELDAVADDVAVGQLQLVGWIQHLRLEELQLQRHRQPLGGSPWPDPHEHLSSFKESQSDEVLETIEVGAAIRIAFLSPLPPEVVEALTFVGNLEHG